MNALKGLALLLLLVPVAGCGSSPKTHFFTLEATAPERSAPSRPVRPVQVVSIHLPPALDRRQMVSETGGGGLDVSDQNRWGGAFGDMIRRVLTQDLEKRLPKGTVIFPREPAPAGTRRLVVDVLDFAGNGAGEVTFDGSWSLVASGADKPLLARHVQLHESAAGPGYAGQARAMSRILGSLADQIAAALVQFEG
ncbi:MAG: hypothetical protein GC201_03950 [Alphaproteobacteria bacterium]|nr:hypothetical protein [Alphaproteobacteria bacterium]